MEKTAKLLSTQCIPRSLAPKTLKAAPVGVGVGGGAAVHDWVSTGVPAHPDGEKATTVRVCVPFDPQALQAL